jgi:hypothetical protein
VPLETEAPPVFGKEKAMISIAIFRVGASIIIRCSHFSFSYHDLPEYPACIPIPTGEDAIQETKTVIDTKGEKNEKIAV